MNKDKNQKAESKGQAEMQVDAETFPETPAPTPPPTPSPPTKIPTPPATVPGHKAPKDKVAMRTYRNATDAHASLKIGTGPGSTATYAADPGKTVEAPVNYDRALRKAGFVPAEEAKGK